MGHTPWATCHKLANFGWKHYGHLQQDLKSEARHQKSGRGQKMCTHVSQQKRDAGKESGEETDI